MEQLQRSIDAMVHKIREILAPGQASVYLYGSVAEGDFRPGWSDIDILVLTGAPLTQDQAELLVGLRQRMLEQDPDNPHYRAFEGGMRSLEGFLMGKPERVVYWGTSGQRIDRDYRFDSFGMWQLLRKGILLSGPEIRGQLRMPGFEALKADVRRHYETIRQHGGTPGADLYAYGWLLDICRCIYTLRTGGIIAKTAAGEWALGEGLCPCPEALERALEIRREPEWFLGRKETFDDAKTLGPAILRFAQVLGGELDSR